ncbi:DnaA ATPase domain-containing protein [Tropicimonas sp. IMCC34011]|uniref:DnaA ATPase domain-containing protein n=1 Tax=Tropicimonas sp. IMCC34011 TaxID=2248759 RepID=UPI000E22FDF1|nr:DnaA/Hda family protein [Tropicimonas sp. IMCC34011]
MTTRQLYFDLPVRTGRTRGDYFVSEANGAAVAAIDGWRNWPGRALLIRGPKGMGKTHLAHVWTREAGARLISGAALAEADAIPGDVAVDDAHLVAGDPARERALFHLYNLTLAEGGHLLLTGDGDPALWPVTLPDLGSRLRGAASVELQPPDDRLLEAMIVKLFDDRQIAPPPSLVAYLLRRMERSAAEAVRLVAALDDAALASGRPIGTKLARDVLGAEDGADILPD